MKNEFVEKCCLTHDKQHFYYENRVLCLQERRKKAMVYHVSKSGSLHAPGTEKEPFLTVQQAAIPTAVKPEEGREVSHNGAREQ